MKVALVGIGKIAVDQHVPSIDASADWELAATVSRSGTVEGVPSYTTMTEMLDAHPEIETISLCLPPVPRFAYAKACLEAGRHVMLEKPPGATLAEVHALERLAKKAGKTLYTTWHSRMAKGVAAAKEALAGKVITSGRIDWRENVRQWHPGQEWIFEPGGMGVLDPGINALSILTEILPNPVHLTKAILQRPSNRWTPIKAELWFTDDIKAEFDWLKTGEPQWEMTLNTSDHTQVYLLEGGNVCVVNDHHMPLSELDEYPALYARMAELVRARQSEVDLSPMVHVSDAMTLGKHVTGPEFHW
ncbi:MAG: Gfo/Idh/MocA family oxidoreductase [Pseudomonadota bacterium]